MKVKSTCLTLITSGMMILALLLTGCGRSLSMGKSPGPQGFVGPQGSVGPEGSAGPRQGLRGPQVSAGSRGTVSPQKMRSDSAQVTVIESSGQLVEEHHILSDFRGIETGSFEVQIRQGEQCHIRTVVEKNAAPYVQLVVEDDLLKIGLDQTRSYHMIDVTLRVYITIPGLRELAIDASSTVEFVDFYTSAPAVITVAGASILTGTLTAVGSGNELIMEVFSGSRVTLSGTVKELTLHASMGSEVNLKQFYVENTTVTARGASTVTVPAMSALSVEASGSSTIRYIGDPVIKKLDLDNSSVLERLSTDHSQMRRSSI